MALRKARAVVRALPPAESGRSIATLTAPVPSVSPPGPLFAPNPKPRKPPRLVQAASATATTRQANARRKGVRPCERRRRDKNTLLSKPHIADYDPSGEKRKAASAGHAAAAAGIALAGSADEAKDAGAARRGYRIRGQAFGAPALEPGLYVVATPIGNLGDVTIRALDTLAAADILACEDTRVTRKLLDRYGIAAEVTAYHEHSGPAAHRRLLAALAEGKSVALVSDAGTPLVSDPGAALVADAREAGHAVVPIPGPSSAVAALSAAGLPSEAFLFLGFLPSKSGQRRKRLAEVARDARHARPLRIAQPHRRPARRRRRHARRRAAGMRLPRAHQAARDVRPRHAAKSSPPATPTQATKGEIVLLVAPPGEAAPPSEADVDAMLAEALRSAGVKQAAESVAAATGLSRRDLYQRALALKAAKPKANPKDER